MDPGEPHPPGPRRVSFGRCPIARSSLWRRLPPPWPPPPPRRRRSSRSGARTPRRPVPPSPCLAVSRTTGYQIKVADQRGSFVVPEDGKIVAWSIALGKPTTEQIKYFNENLGGPPTARLTVLRQGKTLFSRVVSQSPVQQLTPFLGQIVQFPLGRALNVKKGYVIALTVPTWAPALHAAAHRPVVVARLAPQGRMRRDRRPDRPDGAEGRRPVPLPLQGAADLLGDAGHAPGAQSGGDVRRDLGSRGGSAASLTPSARFGTCGAFWPSRSSRASMTSGSNFLPAPACSSAIAWSASSAGAVRARGRHRHVGVAGEDHARADRDPLALEPVRVAGAVPVLVLVADDRRDARRAPWCARGCARRRSGART